MPRTSCLPGLILLVFALGLPGWALAATAPVGRVAILQGQAEALSAAGDTRALAIKAPIHANDTIRTGPASRLQLFFLDETILSLGPESSVTIDQFVFDQETSAGAFAADLARGTFRMVTGAISRANPEQVKVKTPAATIGIRGCYLAGVLEGGQQSLTLVFLGGLRGAERGIYAENAQGTTDLTMAGFGLTVPSAGAAPSPPIQFSIGDIQNLLSGTELTPSGQEAQGGEATTGRSGVVTGSLGGPAPPVESGPSGLGDTFNSTAPPVLTLPEVVPEPIIPPSGPPALPEPPPPPPN
ncbi:MAG: FecR domain-containing protein [Thermodesulfobacteriota bacterium]